MRGAPRLRSTAISLRCERTNSPATSARKNSTSPSTGTEKANNEPVRADVSWRYWRRAGAGEVSRSVWASRALARFWVASMRASRLLTAEEDTRLPSRERRQAASSRGAASPAVAAHQESSGVSSFFSNELAG